MRRGRGKERLLLMVGVAVILFTTVLEVKEAPASVEEQRNRLPPPARDCDDPITGDWMGHEVIHGRWYRFTLEIKRVVREGPELEGRIVSHSWDGNDAQSEPPDCEEILHNQFIGEMPAEGLFKNNAVAFTGQSWKVLEVRCGSVGTYYPDGFSGELIHEGTEFQSENDDGHNPIVPVVFRRIRCEEADKPIPSLKAPKPPANYSSGCGGCF